MNQSHWIEENEIGEWQLPVSFVQPPWQLSQYKLISWKTMFQFSARRLLWCIRELRIIRTNCFIGSHVGNGGYHLSAPLDHRARDRALSNIDAVEAQFRELAMGITADMIKEIADDLKRTDRFKFQNFQWLIDQITTIESIADKELQNHLFFFISPERVKFFPKIDDGFHIFGEEVANAFPSSSFDIAESGICLALSRGTACVFHLMRVLEIGLTVLGKKFDVSLDHTNWAPAIGEIECKIKNIHKDPAWKVLADYKEQQEFYAQIASHFVILKDAWRNYTMHVRGVYTVEQAESIFDTVKAFMQKLALRITE